MSDPRWQSFLSALFFSLKVAVSATVLAILIAIPLAYWLARRRFPGKAAIETLLTVPLVLPPTVVGYYLLVIFGARSPIGQFMLKIVGHTIILHPSGAVLAAMVVALPLLYLPAKAAFAGVPRELEDVARLLGASPLQTFWHVSLPLARRGIASGTLLAFARALGEFGATVMVLGDQEEYRTLPISIYSDFTAGDRAHATIAVIALTAISLIVIFLYNHSPAGKGE
jgi:molybdate transport system permease protein